MVNYVNDLDTPLLKLSPTDSYSLRDSFDGTHCFGGIGSGKTSGFGQTLAGAFLRAGMGGLVLCAKPEEAELWREYVKKHGRQDSLIEFDATQGYNFIEAELSRHGLEAASTVTECLMRILDSAQQVSSPGQGGAESPFWEQATRQCLNHTLPLLYAAHGRITIGDIIRFVSTVPNDPTLFHKNMRQVTADGSLQTLPNPRFADAYNSSFALQTIHAPMRHALHTDTQDAIAGFWHNQWATLDPKLRSNITMTISARLDRFAHGRLRKAFCDRTTIVPEMTFHGGIILMNMPALTWNEDGIIGQQLFKYMWQRAVQSRNGLAPQHRDRPVFLWADEAQYFVSSATDEKFLSTCRGSRAAVVFMTQTLPSYYAALGNHKTDVADGIVGKFSTQVFAANACNRTNKYASELIGRDLQLRRTSNQSVGTNRNRGMNDGANYSEGTSSSSTIAGDGHGGTTTSFTSGSSSSVGANSGRNVGIGSNESESWGTTETMDNILEPNLFSTQLRAGGKHNDYQVSAIWFKTGARFKAARGDSFLLTTFKQ
jgi:TraM recognition site of TraD and TraG